MPLGQGKSDPEQTRAAYDAEAAGYDSTRNQELFERPWLERALADVPQGAAVLDLGCGTGAPIGVFLAAQGYALTGVDFSAANAGAVSRAPARGDRAAGRYARS